MDFNDIKLKLNIKSICFFEKISGHNYFKMEGEDIPMLVYAMIVCNNDITISYPVFLNLMNVQKFTNVVIKKYKEIVEFNEQFNIKKVVDEEISGETENKEMMTMTEISTNLIMQYHLDAEYVMTKMELWEIDAFAHTGTLIHQSELVDKRFWAYLQIAPQVDNRKIKKPEDLFKFVFEQENRKKQAADKLSKISNKAFGQTIG